MRRFLLGVISALAVVALVIVLLRNRRPEVVKLNPIPQGLATAWPLDHFWSWTIPLPDASPPNPLLTLQVRQSSVAIQKGVSSIQSTPPQPVDAKTAEHISDTGSFVQTALPTVATAIANVQLIDLEAGYGTTQPAQAIRIRGSLSIEGTQVYLDQNTDLPKGRIAGWNVRQEARWSNNELYLMRFFLETDDRQYAYDVVVTQTHDASKKNP